MVSRPAVGWTASFTKDQIGGGTSYREQPLVCWQEQSHGRVVGLVVHDNQCSPPEDVEGFIGYHYQAQARAEGEAGPRAAADG